jgi:TatD DNase family protein
MSKQLRYIDVHSHLQFQQYDADRVEVISRANAAGVAIINVGTDLDTSKKAVEYAHGHENMWAIVGLHPTDIADATFDYDAFKKLALDPKVVAIGECGLDFFHSKPEDIERQKTIFIDQIRLANEIGKPLMLHVRNGRDGGGEKSAYQEALQILKEHAKVAANFHFFAGTSDDLRDIVAAGYTVSFTGVLTFTKDYDELVKMVPEDRIMSETDAPFVSPAPYRGKRNESSYVVEVVKAIARIKEMKEETMSEILVTNAKKFFNIDF